MKPFSFERATTPQAPAAAVAARPGAKLIAGGTNLLDLLDLMKLQIDAPVHPVDVNRVVGLDRIEDTPEGGLRVGALAEYQVPAHADATGVRIRDYPLTLDKIWWACPPAFKQRAYAGDRRIRRK